MATCAVVAAFVLVLSACGNSSEANGGAEQSGAADDGAATDDASASALASHLGDGSPLTSEQTACLATVLIEVVDDAGFLAPTAESSDDPADLLTADADLTALDDAALGKGVSDCGVTFGPLIAEAMGGGVDDALVDCLDEQFAPEVIGRVLLSDMTGAPLGDRTSEDIARGAAIACAHHLPDPSGDTE